MSLAKAFLGGAIGAAIATAVWLGVENVAGRSMPWLALLVGLLAGLGVRCCCGQDQRSPLTGAIAAIMVLLGVGIGPFANQLWLEYDFQRQAKPAVRDNRSDDETESNDDVSLEDEDTIEEGETSDDSDDSAGGAADLGSATTPNESRSSTSIIAAARPYLAQMTGDGAGDDTEAGAEGEGAVEGPSAIRAFFDKYLELILYAGSAILAYVLGSGGKKKEVVTSAPKESA